MLTAMYYSPGGAQRVIVIEDQGAKTKIETRDGDVGLVETKLLRDYREEVI